MPANTFCGTIISGGGGVANPTEKSVACRAYRAACKEWCRKKDKASRKRKSKLRGMHDEKGGFNDYFYRQLAHRDPKVAGAINRETAGMFSGAGKSRKFLGTVEQVAAGGTKAGKNRTAAAGYLLGIMQKQPGYGATGVSQGGPRGADKMRGAAMRGFFGNRGKGGAPKTLRRSIGRPKLVPLDFTTRRDGRRVPKTYSNIRFQDGVVDGHCIEIKGPGDTPRPGQVEDAELMSAPKKAIVVDAKSCGVESKYASGCPK